MDYNYPIYEKDNNMLVFPFLSLPLEENILKEEELSYPVDLKYLTHEKYNSIINESDGLKIEDFPDDFIFENDLMKIQYESEKVNESQLKVEAFVELKKAIYPPEDYKLLKRNFGTIVRILNKPIVVTKKMKNIND